MDRLIIIERQGVPLLDEYGNTQQTWALLCSLRAQKVQGSTEEFIRAYGASSETIVIFRTRYVEGITVADRLIHDGQVHDIKETKEIGRRRGMELRTIARGLP
jgi:head-tail adaptor